MPKEHTLKRSLFSHLAACVPRLATRRRALPTPRGRPGGAERGAPRGRRRSLRRLRWSHHGPVLLDDGGKELARRLFDVRRLPTSAGYASDVLRQGWKHFLQGRLLQVGIDWWNDWLIGWTSRVCHCECESVIKCEVSPLRMLGWIGSVMRSVSLLGDIMVILPLERSEGWHCLQSFLPLFPSLLAPISRVVWGAKRRILFKFQFYLKHPCSRIWRDSVYRKCRLFWAL